MSYTSLNDWATNAMGNATPMDSGTRATFMSLQRKVGVTADGVIGPGTVSAYLRTAPASLASQVRQLSTSGQIGWLANNASEIVSGGTPAAPTSVATTGSVISNVASSAWNFVTGLFGPKTPPTGTYVPAQPQPSSNLLPIALIGGAVVVALLLRNRKG